MIVMYIALDDERTARRLWSVNMSLSKENRITFRAYCTIKRTYHTFHLYQYLTCHALTTPDDAIAQREAKIARTLTRAAMSSLLHVSGAQSVGITVNILRRVSFLGFSCSRLQIWCPPQRKMENIEVLCQRRRRLMHME